MNMLEMTMIVIQQGDKVGAIGVHAPPAKKELEAAQTYFVFRRGQCRIHCLSVSPVVTLETCRELAIKFYEGRVTRVNLSETHTPQRTRIVSSGEAVS